MTNEHMNNIGIEDIGRGEEIMIGIVVITFVSVILLGLGVMGALLLHTLKVL